MEIYNLTFKELKEKAKAEEISNATIHRWIQLGLIPYQKKYHNLYSNESVEKLRLCISMRSYGKDIHEMRLLFDCYPLPLLTRKIGKITPDELNRMIQKAIKKC